MRRTSVIVAVLLGTAGCLKSEFGGTADSGSAGDPALRLINSKVTLYHFDSNSALLSGGAVAGMTNLVVDFDVGVSAPLDLAPDAAVSGSRTGDLLRLTPSTDGASLGSPISKGISVGSAAIFLIAKTGSTGNAVSFNAFDRDAQAFDLSLSGTAAAARYVSSATDHVDSTLSLPSSGLSVIGASFSSEGEIDLSVNGTLERTSTVTGSPGTPFNVPRVLSLGPLSTSEFLDFKEVLVFGRALTPAEQGALILYFGKKYGVNVTLDPLLAVPDSNGGGGTVDPNFAPAQAVIESKCLGCHGGWSGARASYYVGLGLVSKGNPEGSKLFYRLQGSSGGSGPKNMPVSSVISAGDVNLIKTWIAGMP